MAKSIIVGMLVLALVGTGCVRARPETSVPGAGTAPVSTAALTSHGVGTIRLVAAGAERELPLRLLGLQAVPLYEHLTDDPAKVAIAREMAPAFVRFPGGMVGNYYNWRTGQLELDVQPNSSATYRFYAGVAQQVQRLHPEGVYIEPYYEFSQAIGAEIDLLVNLETSSVAEQVAWFRQMKAEGVLPRYLELGNEFWLSMMGDPNVLRQWPDAPTALRVMQAYRDALLPYAVPGTKFAVQSAAPRFNAASVDGQLVPPARFKAWDEALQPAPWFDAVTIHLYPDIDHIAGPGTRDALPAGMDRAFPALMARCDQGVAETIGALEERLPGKEVWITEWSGFIWMGASQSQTEATARALGLHVHLTTRILMTFLQHSSVTMAEYHMLNFTGAPMSLYRYDASRREYVPLSAAVILKWFNQAANGGATYQRLTVEGAARIASPAAPAEGYDDIEAAQFRQGNATTVFIHNAGPQAKRLDVAGLAPGRRPDLVESALVVPAADYSQAAPAVVTLPPGDSIEIPPYSVTRLVWA